MDDTDIRAKAAAALAQQTDDADALQAVVFLLAAARSSWEWVGIYVLAGNTLVLGPFAGVPTEHTRIPVGRGVCGTAVAMDTNLIVDDVERLDNYLACSPSTRSEMVVLIRHDDAIVGQFDVDSDQPAAFGPADETLLEDLARLVAPRCAALAERARTMLA